MTNDLAAASCSKLAWGVEAQPQTDRERRHRCHLPTKLTAHGLPCRGTVRAIAARAVLHSSVKKEYGLVARQLPDTDAE